MTTSCPRSASRHGCNCAAVTRLWKGDGKSLLIGGEISLLSGDTPQVRVDSAADTSAWTHTQSRSTKGGIKGDTQRSETEGNCGWWYQNKRWGACRCHRTLLIRAIFIYVIARQQPAVAVTLQALELALTTCTLYRKCCVKLMSKIQQAFFSNVNFFIKNSFLFHFWPLILNWLKHVKESGTFICVADFKHRFKHCFLEIFDVILITYHATRLHRSWKFHRWRLGITESNWIPQLWSPTLTLEFVKPSVKVLNDTLGWRVQRVFGLTCRNWSQTQLTCVAASSKTSARAPPPQNVFAAQWQQEAVREAPALPSPTLFTGNKKEKIVNYVTSKGGGKRTPAVWIFQSRIAPL